VTVLRCAGLSRSFGALKAVDDVDLAVESGARHALIGPNGAGKSTLFKLVTGTMRAAAGTVELNGQDVSRRSEVQRCRLGMSQTMQHASLFASMTAAETVALAVQRHDGRRIGLLPRKRPEVRARAEELLADVGLAGRSNVVVPSLAHGERKQLEVALALACNPSLLLLDEPAAGMSAAERARLVELVQGLPAEITVRKPIRGPSETRISPIEPEWASVDTGPPTNVACRLPIHGEGKPGVATPMQFGPTIAMPAARSRSPMRCAIVAPSAPASLPSPGVITARTPSTERTSSIAATMRRWPTPITTISGTVGQAAMPG